MTAPDLSVQTDNGRFYRHPLKGNKVPSITNITNIKAKPGIAGWGYRTEAEFVADNLPAISQLKDRGAIIDLVRQAPYRSTDQSSLTGDVVHDWIDRYIKGEKIPDDEFAAPFVTKNDKKIMLSTSAGRTARNMWTQFLGIEEKYPINWLMSETTVWSEKYDYAGTLDWIANIGPSTTLGDTKTGNNVYPEVGMQLAAIVNADYAIDAKGNQFQLPPIEKFAVLHLRPRGGRLHPIVNVDKAFTSFLGLRDAFEWDVTYADETVQYAPKIESARIEQ
jgi:hypothetical protein